MPIKLTNAARLALFIVGCGGSAPSAMEPTSHPHERTQETRSAGSDPLEVSGLRGTLSQNEIRGALEPRMMKLSRCVERRASAVEWISGELEFTFLIARDGKVVSVFPSKSTFGDREAERCMTDIARATRFPAPHGGEAEFAWSLEVPLDGSIREPLAWGSADAADVLGTSTADAMATCGGGAFNVTAYIETDGHVVSAGAATTDQANVDKLDCVAEQVKAWTFPSPGSYPAKIQFELR